MRKWKGRFHAYGAEGDSEQREVVLGLVAEMSKTEARTKLRELIMDGGSLAAPVHHVLTFGEYWREHYKPLRRGGWSEPTEAGYDSYAKCFLLPTLEYVAVKDIDHSFLAALFNGLAGRCGLWTLKKVRMMLKSIFEEAVNDDLIRKNPMRRLPLPNCADPAKPVLSKGDAAIVLKKLAANDGEIGIRDYAMTRIGAFCAVRSAEVFGLCWESYLGSDLFIQNSAWAGKLFLRHTKKAKPRKVAVDTNTQAAIERWKKICKGTQPGALMFCAKAGIPFTSRNWLERNLHLIGKELGIKMPLTFQVLRRSFATHNQAQLKDVQAHLGHENPFSTANLYVVSIPEEVRRTQEKYAAEIDHWNKKAFPPVGGKRLGTVLDSKVDGNCWEVLMDQSLEPLILLVSAAGIEPATHALKGRCSTN